LKTSEKLRFVEPKRARGRFGKWNWVRSSILGPNPLHWMSSSTPWTLYLEMLPSNSWEETPAPVNRNKILGGNITSRIFFILIRSVQA
jgi:hypothetical protein